MSAEARCPKDVDICAHMVSSRNTSSRLKIFTSDRKQGAVPEITGKNSDTGNVQKRRV
jgi:hypothetical protein